MPYGTSTMPPSYFSGGGYSANPVSSGGGGNAYVPPTDFGGGGGYGGFSGPVNSGQSQNQGSGGGMDANMWMALFSAIGNRLTDRMNSGAVKEASRADIPTAGYSKALGGMVKNMASEGALLKESSLSPRAKAAATAAGASAANQRGLSGPLAAAVSADSVNEAQSGYDQWRLGALNQYRQAYLQLVQQYMQALQQRKMGIDRFNAASREAEWSKVPVGPLGKAFGTAVGIGPQAEQMYNDSAFNPNVASF